MATQHILRRASCTCLTAWLVAFSAACVATYDERESPLISSGADGTVERRLLQGEYPYTANNGASLVCAEWEIVSAAGEVMNTERESYPFATMNRHLENVGTAQAVPHVDADFKNALRDEGISRIESCEDAREYVRLGRARIKWQAPSELRLPNQTGDGPIDFGAAALEDHGDEVIDKIINGASFDHASTVGIAVFGVGGCTGNLIGPFAMLTAAHCVESTGFKQIKAWIQPEGGTQKCITSPGGGPCPAFNGAANVYAQVDPNWDALGYDQAVIIQGAPWFPPANTASRWTRFAANWGLPLLVGLNALPVQLDGYGIANQMGTGAGVGRRGKTTVNISSIDSSLTLFFIPRPSNASSGICHGDSGSGPYNTTLLGGTNLLLGVDSSVGSEGACQAVGASAGFTIPDSAWISNLVTFFGGTCTTFSVQDLPYVRCW